MNNDERVYMTIKDYIFILDDDTWVEQKSNRWEFAHTKGSSEVERAGEQLTLAKIRELI